MYFYFRDDGRVAFHSQERVDTTLRCLETETSIELDKNPVLFVKNNTLEKEMNPLEERRMKIEKLKDAKTVRELAEMIAQIM